MKAAAALTLVIAVCLLGAASVAFAHADTPPSSRPVHRFLAWWTGETSFRCRTGWLVTGTRFVWRRGAPPCFIRWFRFLSDDEFHAWEDGRSWPPRPSRRSGR